MPPKKPSLPAAATRQNDYIGAPQITANSGLRNPHTTRTSGETLEKPPLRRSARLAAASSRPVAEIQPVLPIKRQKKAEPRDQPPPKAKKAVVYKKSQDQPKGSKKKKGRPRKPQAQSQAFARASQPRRDAADSSYYEGISHWVRTGRPISIVGHNALEQRQISAYLDNEMPVQPFSVPDSVSRPGRPSQPPTIVPTPSPSLPDSNKEIVIRPEKLRVRRILRQARADKQQNLKTKLLEEKATNIIEEDAVLLTSIMDRFRNGVEESRIDNTLARDPLRNAINEFTDNFRRWKDRNSFGFSSDYQFSFDTAVCKSEDSNEAILQRTVMMNLLNRWDIQDIFSVMAEGKWLLREKFTKAGWTPEGKSRQETQIFDHALPSDANDILSEFKPDLAVYFSLQSLTRVLKPEEEEDLYSKSIPWELERPKSPERVTDRCFPFMFLEAKRSTDSLNTAFNQNLINTSQALYNISRWMQATDEAEEMQEFYGKVRVFSISLNAQDAQFRIHRAGPVAGTNEQEYLFEELKRFSDYTRDDLVPLIRRILEDYAREVLYPILRRVYRKVVEKSHGVPDSTKRANEMVANDDDPKRKRLNPNASFGLNNPISELRLDRIDERDVDVAQAEPGEQEHPQTRGGKSTSRGGQRKGRKKDLA